MSEESKTETKKEHTFGDLLKQNMVGKEKEWRRVGRELSAGINISKKLLEIQRARQEMHIARELFLGYERGELKCPFERRLGEARQLLHKLEISFLKSNIPEEKWEVLEELRNKLE